MLPLSARLSLAAVFLILMLVAGVGIGAGADLRQALYKGNSKTYIFHAAHCRYYSCNNCVVEFLSRQAALDAGFRPCKICKP